MVSESFPGRRLYKSNVKSVKIKWQISHSVFHWFLHKIEALPAGVKLMFVRTFEVQQVADNLKGIAHKKYWLVLCDRINTSSTGNSLRDLRAIQESKSESNSVIDYACTVSHTAHNGLRTVLYHGFPKDIMWEYVLFKGFVICWYTVIL